VHTILSWVLQTLASSTLVILGRNTIDSGRGKFLSHHLERKITELRHAHEEKIGTLRAQFSHLQDRGRRANELEFEATTKIWHAF
jgi:hypothetical protein